MVHGEIERQSERKEAVQTSLLRGRQEVSHIRIPAPVGGQRRALGRSVLLHLADSGRGSGGLPRPGGCHRDRPQRLDGGGFHGAVRGAVHRRTDVLASGRIPHSQEHEEESTGPCHDAPPGSLRHDGQREGAQDNQRLGRGHPHLRGPPAPGSSRLRGPPDIHSRHAVLLRLAPSCTP